jgi:thiopurine S-methyltransferase
MTWQNHEVSEWLKPLLSRFPQRGTVLVPLCGLSWDLMYLYEQGWRVIGVDCSQVAMETFLRFYGLPFEQLDTAPDCVTLRHNHRLELIAGDIHQLTTNRPDLLGQVDLILDRAAFVALPPSSAATEYLPALMRTLRPTGAMIFASLSELPVPGGPPHVYEKAVIEPILQANFRHVAFDRDHRYGLNIGFVTESIYVCQTPMPATHVAPELDAADARESKAKALTA